MSSENHSGCSVGRMAMGGAGINARGAPPDERQQPRHRADEAGPSGASGCASRVASSALVAKNRDRPIGRTNMDILKGPEADCGARALPPRAAFSKVARERGISSGRRRGLAPAVDPRDTTSASPVSPNPARDELHSRCCIWCLRRETTERVAPVTNHTERVRVRPVRRHRRGGGRAGQHRRGCVAQR